MAKKTLKERLKTFADVCAECKVDESSYAVPESATNKEKAAVCLDRVKLIAKAFNGGNKVRMADTSQYKYYPWYRVVPDEDRPSGFGLASYGYDYAYSDSYLGARPYFLDSDHAVYAGKQFIAEFEAWAQYEDAANQEF